MIKLIVSDLDGTLLDHARRIHDRDLAAVRTALDEGFELCIASGRMYSEIKIVMQEFKDRYHAIGQNGATVRSNDGELLASSVFEPEVSSRILQATRGFDQFVNFIHCTDDSFYLKERTDITLPYEARILTACTVRGDLETALQKDELRCSKLSYLGDLEQLYQLKAELSNQFEGKIETFISDKDCLDVMPVHVSKGIGLSLLIQRLGLHPNEVACIGDSFNDLSMFAITKHSYAMSGSHVDIKNQAGTVIHSVADAIDHIISYNRFLVMD
ncbi:HAD family hydrolase [Paenibacillus harenae]|uniref:Cof subfamily protein (Haloacid dehalogenase superfamily) n=1 Tax=Paenibacillus harenae TaxID=306543 RepID=A0ABT9U3N6_PAEHA|nr:HAD family hydrolase [Paenibacillus harenae]MDQ0113847.1 Cof subfamily protein (haloacid dehalogenase superfamily) [Paenibacillus harenae]